MVQILNYETVNKNKTIGFVDVRVPILKPTVLIFRRIAHIQSGDRKWLNLPAFSTERADGSRDYKKYVEFETAGYNVQLLECMREKVDEYCKNLGIHHMEPMNFDSFSNISENEIPF